MKGSFSRSQRLIFELRLNQLTLNPTITLIILHFAPTH